MDFDMSDSTPTAPAKRPSLLRKAFTTHLYVTVLVSIVLGAVVGLIWPNVGTALQPLGDGWISLIRMLIGPVVFCAIVTGIASAGQLAGVGRIGLEALVYFEVVTTIALIVGLVVVDVIKPGAGVNANPDDLAITGSAEKYISTAENTHWYSFLINIIPDTVVSAFTGHSILQVLLVALLFAISLRVVGAPAAPVVKGIKIVGDIFFDMVRLVLYLAPIGAFGAMAYATGAYGWSTLQSLASLVVTFWVTGILFCLTVFGIICRMAGIRVLRLYSYFKPEILVTLGTSNYEAVMPQLMEKLIKIGCPPRIVNLVVPAGYAFNSDGVCLYLGFSSLFLAQAFGIDMSLTQQLALLAVFLITSKGAAGVAGAGFVILAATLPTTGVIPVAGIMLILGVDRFMSTMRGLVSLSGQMLGSIVVSRWEKQFDPTYATEVMKGHITPAVIDAEPAIAPKEFAAR